MTRFQLAVRIACSLAVGLLIVFGFSWLSGEDAEDLFIRCPVLPIRLAGSVALAAVIFVSICDWLQIYRKGIQ